ncbi:hypothetical protein AB0M43_36400 [Longispora sp. NPDC051575]|uniref:SLOG cluster 4 domain-containing protein n=1 Tax=Longispora sp. NPDC051575 TaxID=3154943 RepID=UPI00341F3690
MALQVSVCGPRHCTEQDTANAHQIGALLAQAGATVICGGGIGVMAAVAAGAREHDGLVIGVRPGDSAEDACPDLSATIVTNMGEARNAIIAWSADVVVVVGGSWGTMSEAALAMRRGTVPVISIGGWSVRDANGDTVPGIREARSPEEVIELVLAAGR